jgi:hypothetical protein
MYRSLTDNERAAISTEMAARLGPLWFGSHAEPDADAATQPVHAATLTSTMTEQGHLATPTGPSRQEAVIYEPVEAAFAGRGLPRKLPPGPGRASSRHLSPTPVQEPMHRPDLPDLDGPRHRF